MVAGIAMPLLLALTCYIVNERMLLGDAYVPQWVSAFIWLVSLTTASIAIVFDASTLYALCACIVLFATIDWLQYSYFCGGLLFWRLNAWRHYL